MPRDAYAIMENMGKVNRSFHERLYHDITDRGKEAPSRFYVPPKHRGAVKSLTADERVVIERAQDIVQELVEKYDHAPPFAKLVQWRFWFSKQKSFIGLCHHGDRTIYLSRAWFGGLSEEEKEETIRHEIAHAVAGPGHGHGRVWKAWAVRCGAKPTRCASVPTEDKRKIESNYHIECGNPNCEFYEPRWRVPRGGVSRFLERYRCGRCKSSLVWVTH